MKRSAFLFITLAVSLVSCQTSPPQKRAYCGLYEAGRGAVLVPDSHAMQRNIAIWVAKSGCLSQSPGRKPEVLLLSVSSDLNIVDAVPLFAPQGSGKPDVASLRSLFRGGKEVKADLGRRKILPK
jgi:hypothetical protein